MEVVTALQNYSQLDYLFSKPFKLFLAGGISNCPDWQSDVIKRLKDWKGIAFNPRRTDFNMAEDGRLQIQWEHDHLIKADGVLFWFPAETLCPITLFELGKIAAGSKPMWVGCHPEYKRRDDVIMQLKLMRPEVRVCNSLAQLTACVIVS